MNSELVLQASHATLAGSLPFPDIVRQLLEAGVEYYHVDYILLQFTFYGANADSVVANRSSRTSDIISTLPDSDRRELEALMPPR